MYYLRRENEANKKQSIIILGDMCKYTSIHKTNNNERRRFPLCQAYWGGGY